MPAVWLKRVPPETEKWMKEQGYWREFTMLTNYLMQARSFDRPTAAEYASRGYPPGRAPLALTFVSSDSEVKQTVEDDIYDKLKDKPEASEAEGYVWLSRNINVTDLQRLEVDTCPDLKTFVHWQASRDNPAAKMDFLKTRTSRGFKAFKEEEEEHEGGLEVKDHESLCRRLDELLAAGKLEGLVA